MGYYIKQTDCEIKILKENFPSIIAAVKDLMGKKELMSGGTWADGYQKEAWFSWVSTDKVLSALEAGSVDGVFSAWRYSIITDNDGNISSIRFGGEKYGDDDCFWSVIAPYVENGSYIEMLGEGGEAFRWCFDNGEFTTKYPSLEWI